MITTGSRAGGGKRLEEELLDRAFRATLHRLRGLHGILAGWATLGVDPGREAQVRERLEEDRLLLARLDWIRGVLKAGPRREVLLAGEAPRVLLAASLGLGTPEEAGPLLPVPSEPRAALALALWAQAIAGPGEHAVRLVHQDEGLVAIASQPDGALDPAVLQDFQDLLETPATAEEIRFRPGILRPGERAQRTARVTRAGAP